MPRPPKPGLLELAPIPADLPSVVALLRAQEHPGPAVARPERELLDALIGTLLSQQNTSGVARRQMDGLRRAYPTWEAALLDGPEGIEDTLKRAGGGLARVKAGYIHAVLAALEERQGHLGLRGLRALDNAQARAFLESLPGVGQKTASLLLMFELGRPALPVDSHIERLAKRLGWVPERWNAHRVEGWFDLALPRDWETRQTFHVAGVRHGRHTCTARRPACGRCVLLAHCPAAALLAPLSSGT